MSRGELRDPGQEVVDGQELVAGIGRQQLAGPCHELAEYFTVSGSGGLSDPNDLPAPVAWVRLAADVTRLLKAVQDRGDAAGGEPERAGQGGGSQWSGHADDVE